MNDCNFGQFSELSIDFTLKPPGVNFSRLDVLKRKQVLFVYDLTNSHDVFDNVISMLVQEPGEIPDYINFNSREIPLELGMYHILDLQVSRFTETERYKQVPEDSRKPCTSRRTGCH